MSELTPRQFQILALTADGFQYQAIGRTIVRVGQQSADSDGRRPDDELIGLMDDPALAERICELLNGYGSVEMHQLTSEQLDEIDRNARAYGWEIGRGQPLGVHIDVTDGNPFIEPKWHDAIPGPPSEPQAAETGSEVARDTPGGSEGAGGECDCGHEGLDKMWHLTPCPIAMRRIAKRNRPHPGPVGEGCVCDGSGRTCPRHGVVL